MDAASLFRQAEKYRLLAKGINDEGTVALLEQMARELERRARRQQSLARLVESVKRYKSRRAL
jgi:hypothetical protein